MADTPLEGFAQTKVLPPTDRDWKDQEARVVRETTALDRDTGTLIKGSLPQLVFNDANAGEAVKRLHRSRMEMQNMLQDMKWFPWSIVNLMPYPLNVNGVLHNRLSVNGHQIAACAIGSPYVQRVIREIMWDVNDHGAGFDNIDNFTAVPWIPKKMAEDYITQFIEQMHWGVLVYEGEHPPDSSPGLKHKFQEAVHSRNTYLVAQCQAADGLWGDPLRRKEVVNHHRDAAQMALYLRLIQRKPEWLIAEARPVGDNTEPCPNCGDIPEKRFAQCKPCGYIYDPLKAYKLSLIEYGHMAMERMKAEEWKEATEIREQREAARSKGESAASSAPKEPKKKG